MFATFRFFSKKMDFCVATTSQHVQNLYLEILEFIPKIFQNFFFIPHLLKIFCPTAQVSLLQKISLSRDWEYAKIAP